MKKPDIRLEIGKAVKADLRWWYDILISDSFSGTHILRAHDILDAVQCGSVDHASTDAAPMGQGFLFGDDWCSIVPVSPVGFGSGLARLRSFGGLSGRFHGR